MACVFQQYMLWFYCSCYRPYSSARISLSISLKDSHKKPSHDKPKRWARHHNIQIHGMTGSSYCVAKALENTCKHRHRHRKLVFAEDLWGAWKAWAQRPSRCGSDYLPLYLEPELAYHEQHIRYLSIDDKRYRHSIQPQLQNIPIFNLAVPYNSIPREGVCRLHKHPIYTTLCTDQLSLAPEA